MQQILAYFTKTYASAVGDISQNLKNISGYVAPTFAADDPLRVEAQRFITEGGKRFRPALSLITAKSLGQNYVWPHLALETFHKYILMHDDIIDRDNIRYGKPTVHAKMAELCPKKPDASHFGHSLALVGGDLVESATYKIILDSELSANKKVQACKLMATAMDEVGWGWYDQFLMDYLPLDSPDLNFDRIEKSIIWVTGKYTIKLPILFGYTIAGKKMPKTMEEFADTAGLLFQTGDDLMGLFGKTENTGKSNFGDIAQGKKTIPMWLAFNGADEPGRKVLRKYVGNSQISQAQAEQVRGVIKESGALAKTEDLMQGYRDKCLRLLQEMQIPQELKQFLTGFVYYLQKRDR